MFAIDHRIQLAAAGNVTAFGEIYKSHYRRVYSLCLRMTRNVADAEDLTQNVFIQVFRQLKTFRGESSFTTWLHRISVNEVLMHFRKPSVRKERTTEDGSTPTGVWDGRQSPARIPMLDHISLQEAIRQLAPGYRAVFVLHDIEGYEHEQIAKILGLAVGTSKSQLHKARLKLRQLLTKQASSRQTTRDSLGPRNFKIRHEAA